MRSKGATIIFGGLALSSLLVVLVAGIIQAQGEPPEVPHTFIGTVAAGATGDTATPVVGVEIRSKDKDTLTTVGPSRLNITDQQGAYGLQNASDFRVFSSDSLASGDEILFFLLSGDGIGEAATAAAVQAGGGDVDIVLQPRSSKFYKGVPLVVDVKVQPRNGQPSDTINVFLNFDPLALQVASLTTGDGKFDQIIASTSDNQAGTIDISASNTPGVAVEALLATITFTPTAPVSSTDVGFDGVFPRETKAEFGGNSVHGNLSGVELVRFVQAVTEVGRFPTTRSVRPVRYEIGGVDQVNLYVFGPPNTLRLDPNNLAGDLTPTFLWDSPNTGGIPDAANDVVSYQVRILPEELTFKDIGNTTTFTPTGDLTPGIVNFQVRAVGTGGRPDAVATLQVVIGVDDIPPDPPSLVAPSDGAFISDNTPLFDWEPSSGDRSTVGEVNPPRSCHSRPSPMPLSSSNVLGSAVRAMTARAPLET